MGLSKNEAELEDPDPQESGRFLPTHGLPCAVQDMVEDTVE